MTNQDWEQRMSELRDAQLVTQRLMERNEKDWNGRFETMISGVQSLVSIVHSHEQRLGNAEDEIAAMRAALTSMMQSIDRFIRGQQSNGH
jgi:hypothetical protein